jgi:hypothetical protein
MSCSETKPRRVKVAGTGSPASTAKRRARANASRLSCPDSIRDEKSGSGASETLMDDVMGMPRDVVDDHSVVCRDPL